MRGPNMFDVRAKKPSYLLMDIDLAKTSTSPEENFTLETCSARPPNTAQLCDESRRHTQTRATGEGAALPGSCPTQTSLGRRR